MSEAAGLPSSGSTPTTVAWDLTDPLYGGNTSTGVKTVYAQVKDNSGKWGPTFTDTIQYGIGLQAHNQTAKNGLRWNSASVFRTTQELRAASRRGCRITAPYTW